MKIIDISLDSTSLSTLLEKAREENIILRTTDGIEFILAEINDFNREIELTRQNEELMAFLDRRAQATKTVSSKEARTRLGLTKDS